MEDQEALEAHRVEDLEARLAEDLGDQGDQEDLEARPEDGVAKDRAELVGCRFAAHRPTPHP